MAQQFPLFILAAGLLSWSTPVDGYISTNKRQHVRDYVNSVFSYSSAADIGWTGDYASGNAGTLSAPWQEATLNRVNFFRSMAGVPDIPMVNPVLSGYAQEAAFMFSVNNAITHFPPSNWPYYTADAALAAQRSNLSSGFTGPKAVTGYMVDYGAGNEPVGHRRWVLYPPVTEIGNGDAPGTEPGTTPVNTLWIIPDGTQQRPETRQDFVAWPPAGYVPSFLVFSRWSFSHPGANFANTTVSMVMDGQTVPLVQEPWVNVNYGDPAIVWVPDGMPTDGPASWPTPVEDQTISVSVNNVILNGNNDQPVDFNYEVTIFDTYAPGPDEIPTTVKAAHPILSDVPTRMAIASAYDASYIVRKFLTEDFGPDLDNYLLIGDSAESLVDGAYLPRNSENVIQNDRTSTSPNAYHLSHTERETVSITLKDEFYGGAESKLTFDSSLAWSTENQAAVVEINKGIGNNWQPIWFQPGPVENNAGFQPVTIDLSSLAGETYRLRFSYALGSGSAYFGTETFLGWAFDNIGITKVHKVVDAQLIEGEVQSEFSLTLPDGDPIFVQASPVIDKGLTADWGPPTYIDPGEQGGVLTSAGAWVEDPILGWNFGSDPEWTYFINMKWGYIPDFPYFYLSTGWFYYLTGNISIGLWLFTDEDGYCYTHLDFGGWYITEPFDADSWKQF